MLEKQANFDLKGKNAVVIGGTSGIGQALALELVRWGVNVAAVSRGEARKFQIRLSRANRSNFKQKNGV